MSGLRRYRARSSPRSTTHASPVTSCFDALASAQPAPSCQARARGPRARAIGGLRSNSYARHRGLMVLRGNRLVGALTEPSAGSPVAAEAAHETPPSTTIPFNVREDLLHFMDRLHLLWSMNNDDYAKEYALVARQPPRSLIGERLIPRTVAAVVPTASRQSTTRWRRSSSTSHSAGRSVAASRTCRRTC